MYLDRVSTVNDFKQASVPIASMTYWKDRSARPVLPGPLAVPLSVLPRHLHSTLLARTLTAVFSSQIQDGELEFLRDRTVAIHVDDAGVEYYLTLGKTVIAASRMTPDLRLRGSVYDYLLLLSRREDADTLFFQRRLKMQGDTELGLHIKNFLDGLDIETLGFYRYADPAVQKLLRLYERLLG